jgi:ABC-2 type transport system ATP-binding protein
MTETTTEPAAPATDDRAIVSTDGLTKRFGDQLAVDDVTLSVDEGVIFAFIGPSGSGKTTTVRLLTGVQSPTSGSVRVWGTPPSDFSEDDRARIGYMPQLSVLFPHLSIAENLRFVASIYGMPWHRRSRLRDVLSFVELYEHRKKRLRNASGGMQRRLALAAALINEPDLLFLDEPTAGIDPVLRRKFWDRFESLRDEGRTLFVTTQYVGEAAYCDRIGVLRRGRLITVDSPEGLRRQAFGGEVVDVVLADRIEQDLITETQRLDYVVRAQRTRVDGRGMRLTVDDADQAIPRIQRWFGERDASVRSVDRYLPPFDDVFVKLVEDDQSDAVDETIPVTGDTDGTDGTRVAAGDAASARSQGQEATDPAHDDTVDTEDADHTEDTEGTDDEHAGR